MNNAEPGTADSATGAATPASPRPTPETDNWDSTALEAPRQQAGEVIERQSAAADRTAPAVDRRHDERQAAEAEALAERQAATGTGPADSI